MTERTSTSTTLNVAPATVEAWLPEVYDQLERLAQRLLRQERMGHTLEPSALVHEAYLKLSRGQTPDFNDRRHFVAIAARTMRQVLVNHAEKRHAAKRGGDWDRVDLDHVVDLFEDRSADVIALDEALGQLAALDPTQAQIVELRFFGGLTVAEASSVLGIPQRTVEREWAMARAWLRRVITTPSPERDASTDHGSLESDQEGVLRSA